ncbi:MAG: hypothetical protein NZ874_10250 [Fimbriimonadales bacterium]|nr:hypothetical protein [Fimbriimonadales bacterium]
MKRTLVWLVAVGAVAALAYAQTLTVRGAVGFGLAGAPDSNRPNASFQLFVKEFEFNGQTRRGGNFSIEVRDANSVTVLTLLNVARLSVDAEEGVAEFSGRGFAVQRTRQGVRRTQGFISVRVEDNRAPGSNEGDPDAISVAFRTAPDANPVFTYEGVVLRGDIRVFEETRSR